MRVITLAKLKFFERCFFCDTVGHLSQIFDSIQSVSHLYFNGEEKRWGKGVDGSDTGNRSRLTGISRHQITMSKGQEPPHHGEEHPRAEECWGKDKERVLPFKVHHSGKDILQKPTLEHGIKRKTKLDIELPREKKTCSIYIYQTVS